MKMKNNEKIYKYQFYAREVKRLCNMKVSATSVGAMGMVSKGLRKRLWGMDFRERIETMKTTEFLRRLLETCGELLSLRLHRKTTN